MILADKIILLRKRKGWSQEELAEQLGVTRQSVSKWEGAQSVPDIQKIIQMSEIFGVTTDYLLKDEIEDTKTEDKEIIVIESKNIPQGIAAMINYMGGQSNEENKANMESEMLQIRSGQVTYAVRDTVMDGKEIKQGNFMGLTDKTIVSVSETVEGAARELIESMMDEDSELISLYFGADTTQEDADKLADEIIAAHEDVEVEVQYGGQPIYSYFISVE